MPPKQSAAIWNPFTAKSRAEQSASEMYPGKVGQDDQRDAARHMLASGYLSKAWGPGIADLIGRAYEFKETPLRHLGALAGLTNYRYDRPIDLHNNATGIELAQKAGDMEEFERLVNAAAERARPTQTPGAPWVPSRREAEEMRKGSAQYAGGGPVTLDHTQPDMADGGRILPDPNLYAGGGLVKGAKNLYEIAHKLARERAALPVEKGGLGLHAENTAAERAKAMGYTQEVYHSSLEDVNKFNPTGKFAGHKGVSGVSVTDNPEMASRYLDRYGNVNYKGEEFSKNVMPLLLRPGKVLETPISPYKSPVPMGHPLPEGYINPMITDELDTLITPDSISRKGPVKHSEAKNAVKGREFVVSNPSNLRSRFAAFDPFEKDSPDLLKAEGGAVTGHFPHMKPHRAGRSDIGEELYKTAFVPQDALDLAMMVAPYGKLGKLAAAGLAAMSPGEAEAGKLKTGVDLLRRSLFGLKPSQEMKGRELVPVQRDLDRMQAELNKAERAAPKVEERTVSIDPGKGSAKVTDTLQKVAETPVSRRTVLKSASGQVMQHALPAHSFADLLKPVEVAKEAAKAVAPMGSASAIVPGLMAKALKLGLDEDAAMRFVAENLPKGLQGADDFDIGTMHYLLRNPSEYIAEGADKWTDLPPTRLNIMSDFLQQPTGESPYSIRGALRNVRRENPEMYKELRETVGDIKDYGFEP